MLNWDLLIELSDSLNELELWKVNYAIFIIMILESKISNYLAYLIVLGEI